MYFCCLIHRIDEEKKKEGNNAVENSKREKISSEWYSGIRVIVAYSDGKKSILSINYLTYKSSNPANP
jgi:hypothetical protein